MPRPKRCRTVCEEPYFSEFVPEGINIGKSVEMTVDEYEVIRIVDFEKRTHDECAEQMNISRTTVTEIYESARYKISDAIVNGKKLIICGGNYSICEGNINGCKRCKYRSNMNSECKFIKKGDKIMRIAVTYENGQIFQHFGHTENFKLYDVENGEIKAEKVVCTNGQGHGALAAFLKDNAVDVLICGGIGGGAQMALKEFGVELYGGASGSCDEAVSAFLNGNLNYNPDVKCSHHDHEHDGESHKCGHNGCGKGHCNHNR